MTVMDTKQGINWFRMRTMQAALRLEVAGMHHSKLSVYAQIKREYGLRGSKARVLEQFTQMVEAARMELDGETQPQ